MPYLIGALIAIYAGYIIYKKVKDIKAGKFCSCNCKNCPSQSNCNDPKTIKTPPTASATAPTTVLEEDIPQTIITEKRNI